MAAAFRGHTVVVGLLLAHGAEADSRGSAGATVASDGIEIPLGGVTALILASAKGSGPAVEALAEAGARVDARSVDGRTALMYAAANGHAGIAGALLRHGADVSAVDGLGESALVQAALMGRTEAVEVLRGAGASWTPSEALLFVGRASDARRALAANAEVHASDSRGVTALMTASVYGHREMALLLARRGADVNRRSTPGVPIAVQGGTVAGGAVTALMLASVEGHLPVVEDLLRAGADPSLASADG